MSSRMVYMSILYRFESSRVRNSESLLTKQLNRDQRASYLLVSYRVFPKMCTRLQQGCQSLKVQFLQGLA